MDLGWANFRMLRVQLGGKADGIVSQEFAEASIPLAFMGGTSDVSNYFLYIINFFFVHALNILISRLI